MAVQTIEIVQTFSLSQAELFAFLGEQENLGRIFWPAKVTRLRDGDVARNGVGTVRQLRLPGGPPFEETVTAYRENELIEYRITKGSPLKNHHGIMRFYPFESGSRLHYTITFEGKVPLVAALVRPLLELAIRRGLKAVG